MARRSHRAVEGLMMSLVPVICFILITCSDTTPEHGPIRIMPLGDSITQGDREHASYRHPLWQILERDGHSVDFVGSLKDNFGGANPVPDFDHDHEGHWGWRADQIVEGIPGKGRLADFLRLHNPHVVMVHLGTNDVFQGESTMQVTKDLREVVSIIISNNPETFILIAQVLPVADATLMGRIDELNGAISRLPADMDLTSQLLVVDQNKGFNPYQDTYDGVHPTRKGEEKVAVKWYETLRQVLPPLYADSK